MIVATDSINSIRTYTLEEIDENLTTLQHMLTYSKHADVPDVLKQIDTWLDRRLEVTNGA